MSGAAPASASTRSASASPPRLRHQDSGADRPARRPSPRGRRSRAAARCVNSRASPSESRSPRFDITSECSSSRTTRLSEPNRNGASSRGEQQRELLGRGEQDVGRIAPLALALRGRRVAGAGLEPDRQRHLGDRAFEVARDVDRERLERRDVERVQPARAADAAAGGDERFLPACASTMARCSLNSTSVGRNPASVLPAPVGAISSAERPARALASSSS